jgi:decaprenylphospho-beta-D-ribofuranose 2-oxidase
MLGRHATRAELPRKRRGAPFDVPGRLPLGVPFDLPRFVLRAANLRVFNALYYALGRRNAGISLIDWDRYFYPLDAISDWNRIYGRAGFYQFQCALPLEGVRLR